MGQGHRKGVSATLTVTRPAGFDLFILDGILNSRVRYLNATNRINPEGKASEIPTMGRSKLWLKAALARRRLHDVRAFI